MDSENGEAKTHAGSDQGGALPDWCGPERSLPAHRSHLDRYGAARTDATSIIAALLARWKHMTLH